MRKLLLALCALTVTVFGQSAPPCPTVDVEGKCLIAGPVKPSESTAPKPPDAVIAAWYKATSAEAAGKAAYAVLMDQIKKAVDEWSNKQIQLTVNALVAQSQLQASCGDLQLDQQALQAGEVKCVPKP